VADALHARLELRRAYTAALCDLDRGAMPAARKALAQALAALQVVRTSAALAAPLVGFDADVARCEGRSRPHCSVV
jgi:hypothetical protein